jgi:hypothetical protein
MRQEVLDYINSLPLGSYLATEETPWSDNGTPLYVKNLKKIYVDNPEYVSENLVATLGTLQINQETTSIRIFLANDAKTIPSNYDNLITDLKATKDITTIEGLHRREVDVNVTYQNDIMISELEVRFIKIST